MLISENCGSSAVSSQARSTSAAAAAARSPAVAWTARDSGSPGGITTRSRGRPRPAASLVRFTA